MEVELDARNPASPLHDLFDWDNSVAGYKWRLQQAREVIRSVEYVITIRSEQIRAPMYVHDPRLPAGTQGYTTIADIRSDEDSAREIVRREFRIASGAIDRAKRVSMALGIEEEIEILAQRVQVLREKVEVRPN